MPPPVPNVTAVCNRAPAGCDGVARAAQRAIRIIEQPAERKGGVQGWRLDVSIRVRSSLFIPSRRNHVCATPLRGLARSRHASIAFTLISHFFRAVRTGQPWSRFGPLSHGETDAPLQPSAPGYNSGVEIPVLLSSSYPILLTPANCSRV